MNEGDMKSILDGYRNSVETLFSFFSIAALAAACRSFLSEDRRSFKGWMRGMVLAVFAAYLVGSALEHYNLDHGVYMAVIGIAGFVADDILLAIMRGSKAALDNPRDAIFMVFDTIFNRKKDDK